MADTDKKYPNMKKVKTNRRKGYSETVIILYFSAVNLQI